MGDRAARARDRRRPRGDAARSSATRCAPVRSASRPAAPPATATCTASRCRARSPPRTRSRRCSRVMRRAGRGVFAARARRASAGAIGGDPRRRDGAPSSTGWCRYGERTGRPITFLVDASTAPIPTCWRPLVRPRSRAANARAVPTSHPQVASRCFGVLIGHQSRLQPVPPPRRATQASPTSRSRSASARAARPRGAGRDPAPSARRTTGPFALDRLDRRMFEQLFPLGRTARLRAAARRQRRRHRATRPARSRGRSSTTSCSAPTVASFLLFPLLNYGGGSYDGVHDMMRDPMTVQGLGDGGAHCGIVCDASMTTLPAHALGRATAPAARASRSSWAVRRLTPRPRASSTASTTAGVLAPGSRGRPQRDRPRPAPAASAPSWCTTSRRAPAGWCSAPTGYVATIVAGETVVDAGELTDARPGATRPRAGAQS